MPSFLGYDEVKERLLEEAARAGLEPFATDEVLLLGTHDRVLTLSVVPLAWTAPHPAHAEVSVTYRAAHALLARDPGRPFPEGEDDLAVDVEYALLEEGAEVELADLEGRVRPLVERLNLELGGEPRKVYYTVATDYAGRAHAVEARVLDVHGTTTRRDAFSARFLHEVARGLRAIGSRTGDEGAG